MNNLPTCPTGKTDLGGVRIRLELDHDLAAIVLPHTHVVRVSDPDVLDRLAERLALAAAVMRRHREHGELPLFGGSHDTDRRGHWWLD